VKNIKKEFEKIAAQGKSISKIDVGREYGEQIEVRLRKGRCAERLMEIP